jgi:nucleoside-diphosphate-sugar epimerase
LGRRLRFVSIPLPVAKIAFKVVKSTTRVLTGGRLNVISSASIGFLTEDNPFTSERARRELGWSPTVRPEQGIPEAFRWWKTHR